MGDGFLQGQTDQTLTRSGKPVRTHRLIADGHEVWRAGIRSLLQKVPEWEVVAEALNGRDAVEKVLRYRPDLIILEMVMGGVNSFDAVRQIRPSSPSTKVLMM